ncbi:MAG: hypothetical protein ACI9VR_005163, partial [Cognaticolwellia sp.]
ARVLALSQASRCPMPQASVQRIIIMGRVYRSPDEWLAQGSPVREEGPEQDTPAQGQGVYSRRC